MFSWQLLILIVVYGIMLLAYYFWSQFNQSKNICKIDLMIATFKVSGSESLIKKIKHLEQEKSDYSKVSSKGGYNSKFFGIIVALIASVVYAWWNVNSKGKDVESEMFFSVTPLFLIAFIEIINTIYQKNKEEIEEKIQSEIDKTKYQLYQHFDPKQKDLTIKLPDSDSLPEDGKTLTYEQNLQISYTCNKTIKE